MLASLLLGTESTSLGNLQQLAFLCCYSGSRGRLQGECIWLRNQSDIRNRQRSVSVAAKTVSKESGNPWVYFHKASAEMPGEQLSVPGVPAFASLLPALPWHRRAFSHCWLPNQTRFIFTASEVSLAVSWSRSNQNFFLLALSELFSPKSSSQWHVFLNCLIIL